ncbi:nOL1/NOP2/sun family protein [Prevotella sp. CAG:1058]|nr:nOL1/NOP2/sun family protein [Prevotella sp. CAG:1058]
MYDKAAKSLKILSAGVPLGEVKGKDIIPDHALALSTCLDTAAFATAELDYDQALSYLRKEAVALPADTPRGYVIVTYKGVPLGFEKNIGNRANNLYPAEWKIKSPHTPEGLNEVIRKRQTGLPL